MRLDTPKCLTADIAFRTFESGDRLGAKDDETTPQRLEVGSRKLLRRRRALEQDFAWRQCRQHSEAAAGVFDDRRQRQPVQPLGDGLAIPALSFNRFAARPMSTRSATFSPAFAWEHMFVVAMRRTRLAGGRHFLIHQIIHRNISLVLLLARSDDARGPNTWKQS